MPRTRNLEARTTYKGDGIEVAETANAGWGWHCEPCEITHTGLDEVDAHQQAYAHRADPAHHRRCRGHAPQRR